MRIMKSFNAVDILEINNVELGIGKGQTVTVREHRDRKDLVIIIVGETNYTFEIDALKRAIDNAQNAHRF